MEFRQGQCISETVVAEKFDAVVRELSVHGPGIRSDCEAVPIHCKLKKFYVGTSGVTTKAAGV